METPNISLKDQKKVLIVAFLFVSPLISVVPATSPRDQCFNSCEIVSVGNPIDSIESDPRVKEYD